MIDRKRLNVLTLTVAAAVSWFAAGCASDDHVDHDDGISPDTALVSAVALEVAQFQLTAASEAEWSDVWQVPARITLDQAATQPLGSIVEGRVLEVRVFPGDRVKQGQIVAVIHSHEVMDSRQEIVAARAAAVSADSASAVADAAAERAVRLLAAKAISQAEADRVRAARVAANAARDAADAELIRAEAYIEHLVGRGTPEGVDEHAALIRAPFAGVVTSREIQPGQVVMLGQPVATVAREGRLGLTLRLPEQAVAAVSLGTVVRFQVAAWQGRNFRARVGRVAPVVDPLNQSIEVWALIEDEGQQLLRAEMSAEAEYPQSSGPRVLTVPTTAVQLYDGETVVIAATRLGEGMLIEARPVTVGRRNAQLTEILSGIVAGDSIIGVGASLAKAEIQKRRNPSEDTH